MHAFATDPRRGLFILAFLVIVIGASLAAVSPGARPRSAWAQRFALLSRESMLLANNVLLVVACGAVLLGTLYPLFLDALGLGKISVGPPYFDTVFVPLMAPLVFLMGVGPLARWKQDDAARPGARACAGPPCVTLLAPRWPPAGPRAGSRWLTTCGLLMAFWIVASAGRRPVGAPAPGRRHARQRAAPRCASCRGRWSA